MNLLSAKNEHLCNFGQDKSQGIEINFICDINHKHCDHWRYCIQDECVKMLPSYQNCKLRSEKMKNEHEVKSFTEVADEILKEKEEIKPEKKIEQKIKAQTKQCNIIFKLKNSIAIDFDGFGIQLNDSSLNKFEKVLVSYEGEVGKPSFKIISCKGV